MWTDELLLGSLDGDAFRGRLRRWQGGLADWYRLGDALVLLGVALAMASLWPGVVPREPGWLLGLTAGFWLLAEQRGLYQSWRIATKLQELRDTALTWAGVCGLAALLMLALPAAWTPASPGMVVLLAGSGLGLLGWRLLVRLLLRALRRRGLNCCRVGIAGSGSLAGQLAALMRRYPWMGLRCRGRFVAHPGTAADASVAPIGPSGAQVAGQAPALEPSPAWEPSLEQALAQAQPGRGSADAAAPNGASAAASVAHARGLDSLIADARAGRLDMVWLALGPDEQQAAEPLLQALADTTVSVFFAQDRRTGSRRDPGPGTDPATAAGRQLLPNLDRLDLLHCAAAEFVGIRLVSLYESPFLGVDGWLKRAEDLLFGTLALLLLALPMALIALGVRLSGPGPVLFKQRRYGLDGRQILVWKFRSMRVCEDGGAVAQAQRDDARITPFGALLRRTSLDELPQLFNVLQGSMSLVGPRPHAVAHNEYYRARINGYMLRHKVKPGITGWAQVHGWRGETDSLDKMGRRIDYDLAYIHHWSLWLDLWILFLTLFRGFVHRNAY